MQAKPKAPKQRTPYLEREFDVSMAIANMADNHINHEFVRLVESQDEPGLINTDQIIQFSRKVVAYDRRIRSFMNSLGEPLFDPDR